MTATHNIDGNGKLSIKTANTDVYIGSIQDVQWSDDCIVTHVAISVDVDTPPAVTVKFSVNTLSGEETYRVKQTGSDAVDEAYDCGLV